MKLRPTAPPPGEFRRARRTSGAALILAVSLALASGPVVAETIWVDPAGSDVSGDGTELLPYQTIQFAVDSAVDGDEIRVRAGTYLECIDLTGARVSLISDEFINSATNSATEIDGTTICGFQTGEPNRAPAVLVGDGSSVTGFTIRGGGDSGVIALGSAAITSNVVRDSGTAAFGGGIYGIGTPSITNNLVAYNASQTYGGGVYVYATDQYGDASGEFVVSGNEIRDNDAFAGGGGVTVFAVGTDGTAPLVRVEDNMIRANVGKGFGGGFNVFTFTTTPGGTASVQISRNEIDGNTVEDTAVAGGGGTYKLAYGGGLYVSTAGYGTESILLDGNTIQNNDTALVSTVSAGAFLAGGGISALARTSYPGSAPDHSLRIVGNDVLGNMSGSGVPTYGGGTGGGGIDAFVGAIDIAPGGNVELTIEDNVIVGNQAAGEKDSGGGIQALIRSERSLDAAATLDIRGNTVTGNSATVAGGGMSLLVFSDSDPDGGTLARAEATVTLANNLVALNAADDGDGLTTTATGGAIVMHLDSTGDAVSTVDLDVSTLADNTSEVGGAVQVESFTQLDSNTDEGAAALIVRNSIVAGNDGFALTGPTPGTAGVLFPFAPASTGNLSIDVSYTDLFANPSGDVDPTIAGITTLGTGIVNVDPMLDVDYVAPQGGPTIDAGDPAEGPRDEPPCAGGRLDLGHLGGTVDAPNSIDLDGDGLIDGVDILRVAVSFASIDPDARYSPLADVNHDGVVDGDDLAAVVAAFGLSCP